MKYEVGKVRKLIVGQFDDDDNGERRCTNAGNLVEIVEILEPCESGEDYYQVACERTGGWWFFSDGELDEQTCNPEKEELVAYSHRRLIAIVDRLLHIMGPESAADPAFDDVHRSLAMAKQIA